MRYPVERAIHMLDGDVHRHRAKHALYIVSAGTVKLVESVHTAVQTCIREEVGKRSRALGARNLVMILLCKPAAFAHCRMVAYDGE